MKHAILVVGAVLLAAFVFNRPAVEAQQRPAANGQRWEYGRLMVRGVHLSFVTSKETLSLQALARRKLSPPNEYPTPTEALDILGLAGWESVGPIKPFIYDRLQNEEPDTEFLFKRPLP